MKKLICKNIYYTYQGKYQKVNALNNINCVFEKGKFYAIVGQSGCGKSTLLYLLGGMMLPTQGEIYADDRMIDKNYLENHRKNNISIIYQSFHLFPKLTILENVMYPMNVVNQIKDETATRSKAEDMLKLVGITKEYYRKFPTMLSGGQQQRVAIARALVSNGHFILADEPTGNLDSENSKNIIDIFKELTAQGYCVVIVTHDLDIASQTDEVYKMKDGKIIEVKCERKK